MAISEHESGSQAATTGTEHTLGTDNDATDGVFQHVVDVSAMLKDDILEIRLYEKARAADTIRQIHCWRLTHAQTDPLWVSPTIVFLHSRRFTLKQTAGTDRSFPWSVRKIA